MFPLRAVWSVGSRRHCAATEFDWNGQRTIPDDARSPGPRRVRSPLPGSPARSALTNALPMAIRLPLGCMVPIPPLPFDGPQCGIHPSSTNISPLSPTTSPNPAPALPTRPCSPEADRETPNAIRPSDPSQSRKRPPQHRAPHSSRQSPRQPQRRPPRPHLPQCRPAPGGPAGLRRTPRFSRSPVPAPKSRRDLPRPADGLRPVAHPARGATPPNLVRPRPTRTHSPQAPQEQRLRRGRSHSPARRSLSEELRHGRLRPPRPLREHAECPVLPRPPHPHQPPQATLPATWCQ